MKVTFFLLLLCPLSGYSQVGGVTSFSSLNLINNARAGGLGASAFSIADGDITQFVDNPAILDLADASSTSFMINPYFEDINFYTASAAFAIGDAKMGLGINYLNYGEFERRDPTGLSLGKFRANDYQLVLGAAHSVGPVAVGINAKFIQSTIESYSSSALALDFGGIFSINPNWTVGMVFENFGFVLSTFTSSKQKLPFDVRIGTTFKPTYMPLRFTLSSNSIVNSNSVQNNSDIGRSSSFIDDALRSVVIGTEILFSDNFQILVGYNHKRKQELKLENAGGVSGLSYGLMLRINRFYLRYSRVIYHAAGGISLISVQTNINDFRKIL